MKIRVTFKDPDTMHDAVKNAVKRDLKNAEGLSDRERELIQEDRTEQISGQIANKWVEYGEYITVEFDTDAGTATVIENGK